MSDGNVEKPWINVESYAHRYAKNIIKDWFIEKWNNNQAKGFPNNYYIFDWIADFRDPMRGIRVEYPIISRKMEDGKVEIFGIDPIWTEYPDLQKVSDNGRIINAVLDVAVCSEGKLKYGIEIVYKHRTTAIKSKFLKQQGIKVYEISALWILNQIRCPASLQLIEL